MSALHLPKHLLDRRTPLLEGRQGSKKALASSVLVLTLLVHLPAAWAVDPTANKEQSEENQSEKDSKRTMDVVQKKKGVPADKEEKRSWFVDALFETHWITVRDNQAANDVYHMLYLRGNWDVPRLGPVSSIGRLSLRLELNRKYIADPDESGFLFGDMRLYYSRPFAFSIKKQEFTGRGYFYWTFPTSKISGQEGNISRPTALVALSKELPLGFTVFLRPFVRLNWAKYAEAQGGMPNQKWILGYDLQGIYQFPLHKPLSFGASWGQDWFDRYATRDGASQPWISEYYWEIFSGYSILTKPVALDAYLALTSGRKTWEDGVWRFHWVDRDETEMYLSISAVY